ncbi:hypothetical protein RI103_18190 [Paraburkholderia sp. FT54]|nr:hypothetical protein [Paraburkholderia sp. FT54]WNC89584.1 hypothetical protein RI103_18190 [Paraburkholderia sp. FT54]
MRTLTHISMKFVRKDCTRVREHAPRVGVARTVKVRRFVKISRGG